MDSSRHVMRLVALCEVLPFSLLHRLRYFWKEMGIFLPQRQRRKLVENEVEM